MLMGRRVITLASATLLVVRGIVHQGLANVLRMAAQARHLHQMGGMDVLFRAKGVDI